MFSFSSSFFSLSFFQKRLALALAKMGGMGILHRNLSAEEQVFYSFQKIFFFFFLSLLLVSSSRNFLKDVLFSKASMVEWVRKKINYGGMIDNPVTFNQNKKFGELQS